jgi:hypothetical protein
MFLENLERELANGIIGLANQSENPTVDDYWEIAAKRRLKFSYRFLRNSKDNRSCSFRKL